ncbi:MAG: polysaccharide biosynthesis/export family protein [Bacteroidales bacterium]|nr:polysaccharide biosynthesis/export family protein [Bacteroidales bacterium]
MKSNYIPRLKSWLIWVLPVALVMSSCVSQKKVKLIQEKTTKEMTTTFENPRVTTYRIQTGDHLYVRVYSVDPKTSKFFQSDFPYLMNSTYQYLNTYVVDEFGYISFSFIEKLYVKGLTVQEVQQAIQTQLDEYFKEATAYVKLVNFQVGVLGEVSAPGNFTIEQDQINVFQAIGLAGGITEYGNYKEVKLLRQTQNGSEVHLLDLTDNRILESPYYYLMPNDVIYIEPRSTKSWAYSQFPYQTLFYLFSIGILGAALFIE